MRMKMSECLDHYLVEFDSRLTKNQAMENLYKLKNATDEFKRLIAHYYGRPLSVSGRPCYILPMFLFIFYGRLILRPW